MDNKTDMEMAFRKSQVLDAIQKNKGNIDFSDLMEKTGMEVTELLSVIGLLAKENRILMRLNHSQREACAYKSRTDTLYEQFMDLLFIHRGRVRNVAYYASQLCITAKYLSTVVKKASGKTPIAWINEEAIKEIEYRLCHTQASIKEIVYDLNFPNLSCFGKFFKTYKGVSPKFYRTAHCHSG